MRLSPLAFIAFPFPVGLYISILFSFSDALYPTSPTPCLFFYLFGLVWLTYSSRWLTGYPILVRIPAFSFLPYRLSFPSLFLIFLPSFVRVLTAFNLLLLSLPLSVSLTHWSFFLLVHSYLLRIPLPCSPHLFSLVFYLLFLIFYSLLPFSFFSSRLP